MSILVVLIGTRGAGKSTILEQLQEKGFFVLTPSTDRPKRSPEDREYYFEDDWATVDLAWEITVGNHNYGMRKSEIDKVMEGGFGVTIFEPGNFNTLETFKSRSRMEVVSIGLDTVETLEVQLERITNDPARAVSDEKLARDRDVTRKCDVVFSGDECVVSEAVLTCCRILGSRGGVLDGMAVRALARAGSLLTGMTERNVQSASYDLRLGGQAWCQGKFVFLDERNPTLKIPAYSYAIVTAHEEIRLPRFLTGRYDLTVSGFMDGLVLSNGPQVDPGYQGPLFCTLFNGRDVPRGVTLGRHFATIEFGTTTNVTGGYSGPYQGMRDLPSFVSENTAVSPGGNIVERIDSLERSIDSKVAPVRHFWLGSLGTVILIHMTIAGWLWFGGPDLAASITGCEESSIPPESVDRMDVEQKQADISQGTEEAAKGWKAPRGLRK